MAFESNDRYTRRNTFSTIIGAVASILISSSNHYIPQRDPLREKINIVFVQNTRRKDCHENQEESDERTPYILPLERMALTQPFP